MAPATTTPLQAPILWMITFCPSPPPFFIVMPLIPTAIIACVVNHKQKLIEYKIAFKLLLQIERIKVFGEIL